MKLVTKTELIKIRDNMSIIELRQITKQTRERLGYVDFNGLFETMGYVHAFNDTYKKVE